MTRTRKHNKTCKVEGCNNEYYAKGYCNAHYQQMWKHGEIKPIKKREKYKIDRTCNVENCDEPYYAKGYCREHYIRQYLYGKPEYIPSISNIKSRLNKQNLTYTGTCKKKGYKCKVDGCENISQYKGFCIECFRLYKKYGDKFINNKKAK